MKVEIGPYEENRKVNVQIDEYDLWNLDHTLALIILPSLKAYKKQLNFSNRNLNKIINAFELIVKEKHISTNCEKIKEGLRLFAEYYTELWT